jgi:hypothetical protein
MENLTTTNAVIIELHDNPPTKRPADRYGGVVNVASINEDTPIERATNNGFNGNAVSLKAARMALRVHYRKVARSCVPAETINNNNFLK